MTVLNGLMTSGQIARFLGKHVQRVRYVIDSRDIEPEARVGIVRLFSPAAVDRVRREIADIDAGRAQTGTKRAAGAERP